MRDRQDLISRLRALDSAAISDALDRQGLDGAFMGLAALSTDHVIAGRAITVDIGPADEIRAPHHMGSRAVACASAENVIMVANNGRMESACWGGILSHAAHQKEVAGTLVDGAVRDIHEARAMGYSVYAKGLSNRASRGRAKEIGWNVAIRFCGVAVDPGDYVIADANGACVFAASRAGEIIALAEEIVAREKLMFEAISQGEDVSDVMGASYETLLSNSKQQGVG